MDTDGWQQRGINPTSLERDWAGTTVPGGCLATVPVVLVDCTCLPATVAGPPDTIGILASLYTVKLGCY